MLCTGQSQEYRKIVFQVDNETDAEKAAVYKNLDRA
jgi:hypothetical protein